MRVLESNAGGISERLLAQVYQTPALVPAMPWLRIPAPNQPIVDFQNFAGAPLITMRPFRGDDVAKWIVRFRDQYAWTLRVVPGWQQNCYLPEGEWPVEVIVSAVNRAGVEGPTAVVRIGLARAE
jgi:hypothetical protein